MDATHLRGLAAGNADHRPPRTSPPGAQLRITDDDGWRITVFATNTVGGRLAELEVRHRLRARAEDRIRRLKDTGPPTCRCRRSPKQIWLELVQLAAELLTWTQLLAWPDTLARTWEPKRLRLRLLAVASKLVTTGRRRILRLSRRWPWSDPAHGWTAKPRSPQLNPTPQHQRPRTRTTGETELGTDPAQHCKPATRQTRPPVNPTHERSRPRHERT